MTYNGWKNYETWLVALHVDNNRGYYGMVLDAISESQSLEESKEEAKDRLIDVIYEIVEGELDEVNSIGCPDIILDFLNNSGFESEVDFEEIALGYLGDYEVTSDNRRPPARKPAAKKKTPARKPATKSKACKTKTSTKRRC